MAPESGNGCRSLRVINQSMRGSRGGYRGWRAEPKHYGHGRHRVCLALAEAVVRVGRLDGVPP